MKKWEDLFNIKVIKYPEFYDLVTWTPFQPVLRDCQTIYPQKNGDYKLHYHEDFELILPFQNTYNCHLDQRDINVNPGQFLLIQPGQSHLDHYTTDAPFKCIHFKIFDCAKRVYMNRIFYSDSIISIDLQIGDIPDNLMKESCDLLYQATEKRLSDTVCNALFQSVFWQMTEAFPPKSLFRNLGVVTEKNNIRIELCRLFEEGVKTGSFHLDYACKQLGISARTLNRLCMDFFNGPPVKAFQHFRAQQIQQYMLEHPRVGIKATAELFHFSSTFTFSRFFSQHFGYPPSRIISNKNFQKTHSSDSGKTK